MHGGVAVGLAAFLAAAPAASDIAPAAPQPEWPGACPVDVAILLDESGSIGVGFGNVQAAALALVDALRGQPIRVTVVAFGTTARDVAPLTDVEDDNGRREVKDAIRDLDGFGGMSTGGATNWDDALREVSGQGGEVAIILTDGYPTTYGDAPASESTGPAPLAAAVSAANVLKSEGTRVVPVGIGLDVGGDANLAAISGPQEGTDYFVVDLELLKGRLYQVASRTCAIPVSALPQPEPADFPLLPVLGAVAGGVLFVLLVGYLVHRRRGGAIPATESGRVDARPPAKPGKRQPMRLDDVRRPPAERRGPDTSDMPTPSTGPRPAPLRRVDTDFPRREVSPRE